MDFYAVTFPWLVVVVRNNYRLVQNCRIRWRTIPFVMVVHINSNALFNNFALFFKPEAVCIAFLCRSWRIPKREVLLSESFKWLSILEVLFVIMTKVM